MAPKRKLRDIMQRHDQARFSGRGAELALFRENLALSPDDERRKFVFAVHGDGGIGKTWLVERLRQIASEAGFVVAAVDDSVYDVPQTLRALAAQFAQQGVAMKRLEKARRLREAPTPDDAVLTHMTDIAVRAGEGAIKGTAIGGAVAEVIGEKDAEYAAEHLMAASARHLRGRRARRPQASEAAELTSAFAEDLNAVDRPIALFFDVYERTSEFLDEWLRSLLEQLPPDVVVTVAGRNALDARHWSQLGWMVQDVPLTPFTEAEAREVMAREGITDEPVVQMIWSLSGGLPLSVTTLARNKPSEAAAVTDVAGTVVDHFLRWEEDPLRQDAAVFGALPRSLDRDLLAVLAGKSESARLHRWLSSQAFVTDSGGRLQYHDVVRAPMIRLARRRSAQTWRAQHRALSDAFAAWREEEFAEDAPREAGWQSYLLEETYHGLCADGAPGIGPALAKLVRAANADVGFARRWAHMLVEAGRDADSSEVSQLGDVLQAALTDETRGIVDYLSRILARADLDRESRKQILRLRGGHHNEVARFAAALDDFNRALEIDPDFGYALGGRGMTYYLLERYRAAVADFTRGLEIHPDDAWQLMRRGSAYFELGRFPEALADYSLAIELEAGNWETFLRRGFVHEAMGLPDSALADYTTALDQSSDQTWTLNARAGLLRSMGRYDDALVDVTRALTLDVADPWTHVILAMLYLDTGRLAEAARVLTTEIRIEPRWDHELLAALEECFRELGRHGGLPDGVLAAMVRPDDRGSLIRRAVALTAIGRHEEAVRDFSAALGDGGDDVMALFCRASVLLDLGQLNDALADLTSALRLDPAAAWLLRIRGEVHQSLGRFDDALADYDASAVLSREDGQVFRQRGLVARVLGRLDEAEADFSSAIGLDDAESYHLRALTRRDATDYAEALKDIDTALVLERTALLVMERARILRRLGRRAEAVKALREARDLEPRDDDCALDLALETGTPHVGSDTFQVVVDVDIDRVEALVASRRVHEWLTETGVIAGDPDDGLYHPGEAVGSLAGFHGLWLGSGSIVGHPVSVESMICPSCATQVELSDANGCTPVWDDLWDAVDRWAYGAAGVLRCPHCAATVRFNDWIFDPQWAFGHFAIRVWNWPPLTPEFLAELSARLGGHRLIVIDGKV